MYLANGGLYDIDIGPGISCVPADGARLDRDCAGIDIDTATSVTSYVGVDLGAHDRDCASTADDYTATATR